MNYKLLSIIIIVIIIVILINCYEGFDSSINNFVDAFNDKNVKLEKLNVSDTINTNKLNINDKTIKDYIINISYPIGSFYFTDIKYELKDNKPIKETNTPLDYGKWKLINNNNEYYIIGLTPNTSGIYGNTKIQVNQIPKHKHMQYFQHNGMSSGDYWTNPAIYNKNGNKGALNGGLTKYDIYDENDKLINEQKDFIPKGYYLFCYKRLE